MTPPQDTHQKREGERESLMSSLSLQMIQQSTGARGDKRPFEHLEAIARERGRRRNTNWMTFISVYSMMYFPMGVGPAFAYTGWVPGLCMLSYAAFASYVSGLHLSTLCLTGGGGRRLSGSTFSSFASSRRLSWSESGSVPVSVDVTPSNSFTSQGSFGSFTRGEITAAAATSTSASNNNSFSNAASANAKDSPQRKTESASPAGPAPPPATGTVFSPVGGGRKSGGAPGRKPSGGSSSPYECPASPSVQTFSTVDSYPKLGSLAFGPAGERFIEFVQTGLYFMTGVFNIAYMPASFMQLFSDRRGSAEEVKYMVVTWGIMCLGSLLPSYHDTFPIAAFSALVSTANAMLQVVVIAFYQRGQLWTSHKEVVGSNTTSLLAALPAIAYAFGGHGVFPEEVRELKTPKDFPRIVKWLYAGSLPWYYVVSIASYACYGSEINGNPLFNWPRGLWVTQCGAVFSLVGAIVISVTTNQATLIAVEEKVLRIDSFEYGMNSAPRILVRFAFIMLQLLAAFVLRRTPLQYLQAFMGSFGVGCLTFWAPFLFYLRVQRRKKRPLGRAQVVFNAGMGAAGAAFSLLGMVFSTVKLISGEKNLKV